MTGPRRALGGPGRRPRWWSSRLGISLLLVGAMSAVAVWQTAAGTAGPVARASDDMAAWDGIAYRGVAVGPSGVATSVDLAVTRDGSAHGTLSRPFGAVAEFSADSRGTVIRGNRAWWLTGRAAMADELADRWVADPPDRAVGVPPLTALTPQGLSGLLTTGPSTAWSGGIGLTPDDPGTTWSDDARTVALTSSPPRIRTVAMPVPVAPGPVLRAFSTPLAPAPPPWGPSRFTYRVRFALTALDRVSADAVRRVAHVHRSLRATPPPRPGPASLSDADRATLDRLWAHGVDARPLVETGVHGRLLEVLATLADDFTWRRTGRTGPDPPQRIVDTFRGALENDGMAVLDTVVRHRDRILGPRDGNALRAALMVTSEPDKQLGHLRALEITALELARGKYRSLDTDVSAEALGLPMGTGPYRADSLAVDGDPTGAPIGEPLVGEAEQIKTLTNRNGERIAYTAVQAARQLDGVGGKSGQSSERTPANWGKVIGIVAESGAAGVPVSRDGATVEVALGDLDLGDEQDRRVMGEALSAEFQKLPPGDRQSLRGKSLRVWTYADRAGGTPRAFASAQWATNDLLDPPAGGPVPEVAPEPSPSPSPTGGAAVAAPETPPAAGAGPGVTAPGEGARAPFAAGRVRATSPPAVRGARPGGPGGIDLRTVELRSLSESDTMTGPEVRYALQAGPATTGPSARSSVPLASGAFFVWLALRPETFWVNLNPDQPDRIVDERLAGTDVGRVLLESDLELKRTFARLSMENSPEAAAYRSVAASSPGTCHQNRVWIVPGPASVREDGDAVHLLDAPLVVQLENIRFTPPPRLACRPPALEQAEREQQAARGLLPRLQALVNTSPAFDDLHRIHLSRVAAEWYRHTHDRPGAAYSTMIDSGDAAEWPARTPWSVPDVYGRYLESMSRGEPPPVAQPLADGMVWSAGGIDLHDVPLVPVDAATFDGSFPDRESTVVRAAHETVTDAGGQLWTGGTLEPSTVEACSTMLSTFGLPALVGAAVLGWWVRRRRRRGRDAREHRRTERAVRRRLAHIAGSTGRTT